MKSILIIGLVILGIGLLYFMGALSFLTIGWGDVRYPLETKTLDWNGNSVYAESPKFGSVVSALKSNFDCDGQYGMTLNNGISSNGNQLILTSTLSTIPNGACSGNGVKATVTIPAGKLDYTCKVDGSARIQGGDQAGGNCIITQSENEVYNWGYGGGEFEWNRKGIYSMSNSNSLTSTASKVYTFEIYSNSQTSSATTTLTLTFTPSAVPPVVNPPVVNPPVVNPPIVNPPVVNPPVVGDDKWFTNIWFTKLYNSIANWLGGLFK